jgi:hypothetical protein
LIFRNRNEENHYPAADDGFARSFRSLQLCVGGLKVAAGGRLARAQSLCRLNAIRLEDAGPAWVNALANHIRFERRQTAFRCRAVTTLAYVLASAKRLHLAQLRNSPTKLPKEVSVPDGHAYTGWTTRMKFLSYAYRFASNFLFLILVYYSLNFLDKYEQRVIVAVMVLVYSAMRAVSALRSFYFFQRIERLEVEARRLVAAAGEGHSASSQRRLVINEVARLRQAGEMKSYIDLLFLALIVLL